MPVYTKFTIKNFRCFSDEQELRLARPTEDKPGSGITYVVGANNSGKTTLIEGICYKEGDDINDSDMRSEAPEFNYHTDKGESRTVNLLRKNANSFTESSGWQYNKDNDSFEIIASRRHWSPWFSGNVTGTSGQLLAQSTIGRNPRKNRQETPVAHILRKIEADDKKYESFTELVKQILPEFTSWGVGCENDRNYIKYITRDNIKHKSELLGDGVVSIILILVHLFADRSSGLIIDEPELSLHPLAQKKLIKLISEYAQKRQIIISTHSPYLIDWEYIKNGAVLNRITKNDGANSLVYTLDKYDSYEKLISGENWQQPFLMDTVSKEIFFQDNILFVEGQEDVGLLRSRFIDTDINLFGYGVRGCGNFKASLKLAKDLGIRKACALIDSPDPSSGDRRENTIKQELEKEFKDYKIVQWNKADIRDKDAKECPHARGENKEFCHKGKVGYFDKNGSLKKREELDDFEEKIEVIKNYFLGNA